ncbi:GNAT family N-acetyltransferase [Macrococcus carouselicus]|uniref:GNAT family N-acetyltransferase n=1 Tax=Macrococcus carouselicus TaxID=69969 RepID=A0A9Q8FQY6_9STAP|nr:GNAT family N-acetyltransferase [Macrococcus carouselicus]TDM02415.1 GNAT family N-acetyltransferase [Macrococcus carouselicus]
MNIREIKPDDNSSIKTIIQQSLKTHDLAIPGSAYFDPHLGELYEFYHQLEYAAYWIAEEDGEVLGGIGIAPFNLESGICELQKLYLKPAGQGRGISKQLMETALSFAAMHYRQCYLETMFKLRAACHLYEQYGFKLLDQPLPGSEHSAMDAWYIKSLH